MIFETGVQRLFIVSFILLTLCGCRTFAAQPPSGLANEVTIRPTATSIAATTTPSAAATSTPEACVSVRQSAVLDATPPTTTVSIVQTYPHDPGAFTQGLIFYQGDLIEGTGLRGRSTVRRVDLETGSVEQSVAIADEAFGEGTAVLNNQLYQLTWQSNIAFVYDVETLVLRKTFRYEGEGWGLTENGRCLIMSSGSHIIAYRDPETFETLAQIQVVDENGPVHRLNELEFVDGEIWANVWQTNRIARIDPESGAVLGWIDASALTEQVQPTDSNAVLNGIAYDAEDGRVFLTGKLWPTLFEVTLNNDAAP